MDSLRTYLATLSPNEQTDYARRSGTSIGYLRKAMSVGQRFDGALVRQLHIESGGSVSLTDLRPDIWPADGGDNLHSQAAAIGALVDSRMSKRAFRSRLGLSSDAHLAKVLGLPEEEVERWPEEAVVPQLPQILRLIGKQELGEGSFEQPDPDLGRVVSAEVA